MFILRLIRYLQGYVCFQAQGDFVERFLNLVARDRIAVWDGRKRGDTYTGRVRAGSYRRMRRHAKKAGVRLRVADKAGAPFHRHRYRKRTGLLIGMLAFAVFLGVMSGFIWRIEVNGNEKLQDYEIIEALEKIGVAPGKWRGSINVRECERLAMMHLPEIAWIALNIQGSTIHVEINESIMPPPMVDPNAPCNIVAAQTGQILTLRVYEGQAMLREGDTVMEGEVIVSGITQDRVGQNLFRHALADVLARTQPVINVRVPLEQMEYIETGETMRRDYLQVFGFDLPLFWPGSVPRPFRVERDRNRVAPFGLSLPAEHLRESFILMEEKLVTLTGEQAKVMALRELAALEKARLGDAEILERKLTGSIRDGMFVLNATYTCVMNIGVEKVILQSGSAAG